MPKLIAAGLVGLMCTAIAIAQTREPPDTVAALNDAAIKAYQAKDFARFLDYERRALTLDPANPRTMYNVACGEALTGHADAAVQALNSLASRKLDLGAEADDDFAAIRGSAAWTGFVATLTELRKPVVKSRVAFRLDDPTLIATGIAIDPQTEDIFIASVRHRKIVRRTKAGAVSDFIREGQDGFLAGASVVVDASRRLLIASSSATPLMTDYPKDASPMGGESAGVFVFDVRSGKLVRKAMLGIGAGADAAAGRHFLNALAIDRAGTIYVSDSGTPGIYKLAPGSDRLELLAGADLFHATQGLALSDDDKTLFVADYTDGLWAVDLTTTAKTRTKRRVDAPADVWLGGMDGLSRVPDGFVTVQIGVKPERVLHLRLDAAHQHITRVDILEMNHPDYAGPIQGDVSGRDFLYIANSQLPLADPHTGVIPADKARSTVILRLPL
jgi:sugar lactone lactonase YvrE